MARNRNREGRPNMNAHNMFMLISQVIILIAVVLLVLGAQVGG